MVLPLRVHTLSSCDLPSDLSSSNVELLALGDFEATNDSAEVLPVDRRGAALPFPAATRAVQAHVGGGAQAFTGYGERRAETGVDVLLWPERTTCVVSSRDGGVEYPGRHGGQALGFAAESRLLLAAGGNDPLNSEAIVGALSFDAGTGTTSVLDPSTSGVLQQPRAFATVTRFGANFLVAAGEQPVFGVPDHDLEPQATAEVFDPELGGFSGELIALRSARTHHAALTLDDGRTLLVGGRTKVGGTSIAQYQLEIVDPESKRASVGRAITPRIDPVALRLSDGRVLVGGGTALDGSLATPPVEWLARNADLDETRLTAEVAPRFERAFVATTGGGVLAVGGCEDRPPASDRDAQMCAQCSHGCKPLDGYDAWWIDRDGAAMGVALDGISAPRPILLPGSDGSPWLVAAELASPDEPRFFRFNPWARSFEPAAVPAGLRLPRPGMPALSLAPDVFVWVDDNDRRGELLGLRLGTRSRYAQDLALVLAAEVYDPARPQHLAPSRPLGDSVSYDGVLTLSKPDVAIQITDTDYADVTVKLHVEDERLPIVLLGATALGGVDCPWPQGTDASAEAALPTIVRRGPRAQLRFRGGSTPCPVEAGRLTLALTAGASTSIVTELEVKRGAPR